MLHLFKYLFQWHPCKLQVHVAKLRVHFFKKIQDWILKSKRIQNWILRFLTRSINPRSFGSWCIKGKRKKLINIKSKNNLVIIFLYLKLCRPLDVKFVYILE